MAEKGDRLQVAGEHVNTAGKGDRLDHKTTADDGALQCLQGDCNLAQAGNSTLAKPKEACAKGEKPVVDIKAAYGSDEGFLRKSPQEMRFNAGLKPNASSEELFNAMGKQVADFYTNAKPGDKALMQQNYGLADKDFTPAKVAASIVDSHRREFNMPGASASEIEKALHKSILHKINTCQMEIDPD